MLFTLDVFCLALGCSDNGLGLMPIRHDFREMRYS